MEYIPRMMRIPQESFFLFGPRGSGKSTWVHHTFPKAYYINLLHPSLEKRYLANPEYLYDDIKMVAPGTVVVIDEVQKVPALLPIIHDLIEKKSGLQFILTGSSARKLRRSSSSLLGGRLLLRYMHSFLASELGEQFSLTKALQFGLVPMIWGALNPMDRLRAYVMLYLKEEVQAEGFVRQIGAFAKFMEVMSFSHGTLINVTEIARESYVKRQTVDNYLHVLEDLLLSFSLPIFSRKKKRRLIRHSKFYYFDPGVFRCMRPKGPLDKEAELEGPALEGLVAQHLKVWVEFQEEKHEFAFWRTRTGVEVDFVVYGPKGFWGIEVKRSQNLSPKDIQGLTAFQNEYPMARCFILYLGNETTYRDFPALSIEPFLRAFTLDQPIF